MHSLNIFGKRKPDWEKLFSPSELRFFYDLVHDYYRSKKIPVVIKNGRVEFPGRKERIELRNIAQTCLHADASQWKEIILSYVRQLQMIQTQNIDQFHWTFDDISRSIAIRLWPEGTLESVGAENLIYRKDIDGIISTVVLDLPETIKSVTPIMASGWGKSQEELFNIGYENTYKYHEPDFRYVDIADQIKAIILTKNDFLTATHILFLDKYPDCVGKYGSLAGIPLRNSVLCYPINDEQFMKAVPKLAGAIREAYSKGPGSVSPYLYWYQNNKFTIIDHAETSELVVPEQIRKFFDPAFGT